MKPKVGQKLPKSVYFPVPENLLRNSVTLNSAFKNRTTLLLPPLTSSSVKVRVRLYERFYGQILLPLLLSQFPLHFATVIIIIIMILSLLYYLSWDEVERVLGVSLWC